MRGGRNVENQNTEGLEHRKFFLDDQNIKSQKDHNIESLIRTSKMTYGVCGPGKVVCSNNVLSKFVCRSFEIRFERKVTFFRIHA